MANNPDKYKSSFQVPDGYFDSFEQNLLHKMNAPADKKLNVSHRTSALDWVAVAATISAVAVSGWFVYQKSNNQSIPKTTVANTLVTDTATIETPIVQAPEQVEAELVEELYTEFTEADPSTIMPVTNAVAVSDVKIAAELEEAGLIVLDIEDGLFDPFEL